MKQKTKHAKTSRVQQHSSSRQNTKSPIRNSREATPKSSKTVKRKREERRGIKGMARRTGDFGTQPSKKSSTPKKYVKANLSKTQKLFPRKSPRINLSKTKKTVSIVMMKKQARRRRRIVPKKELQIVIETPKISRGSEINSSISRSRSSSRKITPNKLKGRSPIVPQSKVKRKLRECTNSKEDDELLRKVRENKILKKSARKRKGIGPPKKSQASDVKSIKNTPNRSRSLSRQITSKAISERKTPTRSQSKTKRKILKFTQYKDYDELIKRVRENKNMRRSPGKGLVKDESNSISSSSSPVTKKNNEVKTSLKHSNVKGIKIKPETPIKLKPTNEASKIPMGTRSVVKDISQQYLDRAIKSLDQIRMSPRKPSEKKSISRSASKSRDRSRKKEDKTLRKEKHMTDVIKTNLAKRTIPKATVIKKEKTPTPSESEAESEGSQSEEKELKQDKPLIVKRMVKSIPKNIKVESEPEEPSKTEEEKNRSKTTSAVKGDQSSSKPRTIKKQVKHELGYKVTKGISEEIAKILSKIKGKQKQKYEEIKKGKEKKSVIREKKGGEKNFSLIKKASARDYDFKLTKNTEAKVEHIVKIFDLIEKSSFTHSDVLLAILEIASNSAYYNITYRNNSAFFWKDIIQYEELSKIFEGYKSETLRKYWRYLNSITDVVKIGDLVKKHKKFLDDTNIKLLSIIYTIRAFFSGKITDFEESIKTRKGDLKMHEFFEETDHIQGEKKKPINITSKQRSKHDEPLKREFRGINYTRPVDEVFGKHPKDLGTSYYNFVKMTEEEENKKFNYLKSLSEEEKKQILSINEEDKFLFKIIDYLVHLLQAEFPHFSKNYITEVLYRNSMNIEFAYQFLRDPVNNNKLTFSEIEDEIMKTMKNTPEYGMLIKKKGATRVQQREDFLME